MCYLQMGDRETGKPPSVVSKVLGHHKLLEYETELVAKLKCNHSCEKSEMQMLLPSNSVFK